MQHIRYRNDLTTEQAATEKARSEMAALRRRLNQLLLAALYGIRLEPTIEDVEEIRLN